MEWKLAVTDAQTLDAILRDPEVLALAAEPLRRCRMRTTYYDTPDRRLAWQLCTLRRRMENEVSVVCVKAPLRDAENAHEHGEWELEAEDPVAALPLLVEQGAPRELLEAGPLAPVCGAAFCRRALLLRFADGSECELACDFGALFGAEESASAPLCEAELEMKQGAPDMTLTLLERLIARYGLTPQERSKYARASAL